MKKGMAFAAGVFILSTAPVFAQRPPMIVVVPPMPPPIQRFDPPSVSGATPIRAIDIQAVQAQTRDLANYEPLPSREPVKPQESIMSASGYYSDRAAFDRREANTYAFIASVRQLTEGLDADVQDELRARDEALADETYAKKQLKEIQFKESNNGARNVISEPEVPAMQPPKVPQYEVHVSDTTPTAVETPKPKPEEKSPVKFKWEKPPFESMLDEDDDPNFDGRKGAQLLIPPAIFGLLTWMERRCRQRKTAQMVVDGHQLNDVPARKAALVLSARKAAKVGRLDDIDDMIHRGARTTKVAATKKRVKKSVRAMEAR
jgi:hypothetical protein